MSELSKSIEVWSNIAAWIKNRMRIVLQFSKEEQVLGYFKLDKHFVLLLIVPCMEMMLYQRLPRFIYMPLGIQ